MLIDIAAHILPPRHFANVIDKADNGFFLQKRVKGVPELWDLNARFRAMDDFKDEDYRQVLTLANPPIERIAGPESSPAICRALNEELRELLDRYPDRFLGAFGYLPLNAPDAAMAEMDHLSELGLVGFEIFSDVDGVPLDHPDVLSILDEAFTRGLSIFIHPIREIGHTDYSTETVSRFEAWQILGWPFATSVAMLRLALTGLFERHPDATLITHHCGGMIPFFASRIDYGLKQLGTRTDGDEYAGVVDRLPRRPIEYLSRFSCDTALSGGPSSIRMSAEFFGADRIFFGSDMPFDGSGGRAYIGEAIEAVRASGLDLLEQEAIFSGNAIKKLRLSVADSTL